MTIKAEIGWLVSCEHGGNNVPASWRSRFASRGARADLASHRGFDLGALAAAKMIAKSLGVRLLFSQTTRLLVDLNRSLDNPQLLSKYTRGLGQQDRSRLLRDHYTPYRQRIDAELERLFNNACTVIHLSVHTFTARYHSQWRPYDVGLLFDPARHSETCLCEAWILAMTHRFPRIRVRANEPYLGTDDGLTTELRRRYLMPDATYLGIEIEISNRFAKRSELAQSQIVDALLETMPQRIGD